MKVPTVDSKHILYAFNKETGIDLSEVRELNEAFPISLIGHIMLDTREFEFMLTHTGKAKKNSFKEVKY